MNSTPNFISEDTTSYQASPITLQDGSSHVNVELTTLENSYCMVAQPFSESTLVPGHCQVTLDHTTRAVQGNWDVLLGIPGKIDELHLQRHVTVNGKYFLLNIKLKSACYILTKLQRRAMVLHNHYLFGTMPTLDSEHTIS